MGLRVWLPLLGNFENKGTSNTSITLASGNSWSSTGKIGNQSLALTKLQTILPASSCMTGAKQMSYAFWVKVNTTWTTQGLNGIRWYSTDGTTITYSRQEFYTNCTYVGTWYDTGNISNKNFIPGEWTHIAATFDYESGKVAFYLNGVLQGTATNLNTTHYCRGDFYIGDNGVDILENDVRIYDHCLSAAEVHEIAQGLIVHYKLDDGNANLLYDKYRSYNSAAYAAYQFNLIENLTADTTYTLQLWDVDVYHSAKTATNTGIWVYWGGGNIQLFNWKGADFVQTSTTNYHADYLVKTFTITSTQASAAAAVNAWLNIYNSVPSADGTRKMRIGAWKLEKGAAATLWKSSNDINIVNDSSGYNRNGNILDTIEYSNSASRYAASINFTDTASGITIPSMPMDIFNSENTISFWINPSGQNGKRSIYCSSYSGQSYSVEKTTNNKLRLFWAGSPDKKSTTLTINDNEWQHIALVKLKNKTEFKLYKNGEYIETLTDTFDDKTWSGTYRLGRDSRVNDSISYIGKMSDFRIYCTVLSDTDIQLLYNVGMRIDNLGEIYSFEFEETESEKLLKTGTLKTNELEETSAQTAKLKENKGWLSSNFIEL